jgi:DNA modification methylase
MTKRDLKNRIICQDVIQGLRQIPDRIVSLVFTSPPYDCGINYGNSTDDLPYQDYLDWLKKVWIECNRVLRGGGRLVVNFDSCANSKGDRDIEYIRPMYADFICQMRDIGLKFRTEFCWYKQSTMGTHTAFGSWVSCSNPYIRRNHEHILVWSKEQYLLEGDSEQSDMTVKEFQDYTLSTWFVSPETRKLANHPAAFPEQLAERVIKLFSYRGDVVLDPFSGTGTTCVIASRFGRQWIGIDNNSDFCKYARDRIKKESLLDESYVPRSERLSQEKKRKLDKKVEIDILG